jgi:hypothetical protein
MRKNENIFRRSLTLLLAILWTGAAVGEGIYRVGSLAYSMYGIAETGGRFMGNLAEGRLALATIDFLDLALRANNLYSISPEGWRQSSPGYPEQFRNRRSHFYPGFKGKPSAMR